MSALVSQLSRFCSGTAWWHAHPFSLKIEGVTWSVATDEHILFAIKLAGVTQGRYPAELKKMLMVAGKDPIEVDVVRLKAWAGEAPKDLIPEGKVDSEHQGVLLEQLIDRRKLAFLFTRITLPAIRVWVAKPTVLGFEPPHKQPVWRAFLAGLGGGSDGSEPVFPTSVVEDVFEMAELVGKQG